jgi:gliding motility-associated-like protein
VSVRVNDGMDDSNVFNLTIKVTAVEAVDAKPVITGQSALTTTRNQPLLIQFTHLTVADPDNHYPSGFVLKVFPGINYSFSETVITPAKNFTGVLAVKVTVNDGIKESDPFFLQVTVQPGVNITPVITGQIGLSTYKSEPLTILLSDLVVNDPDNNFPADFTLSVLPGDNYTVAATVIKPLVDFVGALSVGVTVNDGNSSSLPYKLAVKVLDRGTLQITGQHPLSMLEDSAIAISLADIIVNDPLHKYPNGFELKLLASDNFSVSANMVTPVKDFNGNLVVPVQVTNGTQTSATFNMLIVVQPVNDAPEIEDLESESLIYAVGAAPTPVTQLARIVDADDENLIIAEAGIEQTGFQSGHDVLTFSNTENIHGVFDPSTGIVSFIGLASLAEYQSVIRSVRYEFTNMGDSITSNPQKTIYFKLNDGKTLSRTYSRQINFGSNAKLDIPNAFTPNNDHINDTWQIEMPGENANYTSVSIHVYNKSGLMVFHSEHLENAWDGKWNGDFLPPDAYFYIIEVNFLYTKKNFRGVVSILR